MSFVAQNYISRPQDPEPVQVYTLPSFQYGASIIPALYLVFHFSTDGSVEILDAVRLNQKYEPAGPQP